ncbi:putative magnesium and cobalt efflux protein CorC [Burkholderia cepacia]|nr:putative magnesium and cobalt efflux protein CorC [Burkholderia cepacia]
MNDSYPSRKPTDKPQEKRSLLERLTDFISPEPESRGELLEILQDAHERNLIDADSLSMIEGVFQVSDLCARDIMVPRAQMDAINIADKPEDFIPFVLEKAHSRYPCTRRTATTSLACCSRRICCVSTPKRNSTCAGCCARPCSFPNRSA